MGEDKVRKFIKDLSKYRLVALDSACFIYHIEENKKYIPFTEVIFERLLPEGIIEAVCSSLVLTEILTRPFVEKRGDLVLAYKSLIASFPNLTVEPFEEETAEQAAYFRAEYNLRTPDAIHIATAYRAKVGTVIGNDDKWKKVKELQMIIFDDYC